MPDTQLKTLRTFLALPLNEEIQRHIFRAQEELKINLNIKASWVKKENFHLTLKFLGETPLEAIPEIKESLKECLTKEDIIFCRINQIGIFPNERFPRVIWVEVEDNNNRIASLFQKIEDSVFNRKNIKRWKLKLEKEKKGFKSHITICRVKNIVTNPLLFKKEIERINHTLVPQEVLIEKIILFQSCLGQDNSIYIPLAEFPLA